jgi:hypothetical protein
MGLFNNISKKDKELNKTSDKIQRGLLSIFAGKKRLKIKKEN